MKRCASIISLAAFVLGLGISLSAAQSEQPSLAEVARQKSAAKARRVVTNDEIPPSPEADKPAAQPDKPTASAANVAAKAAPAKPNEPPNAPNRLQQLTAENEDLHKVIKQLEDKIATATDNSRIANLSEVVQHAKQQLAANQAEIDKLKAAGTAPASSAR